MAEAELEMLRARLAALMTTAEEAPVPQKPKVIEPLNLEGVASHIKKISNSNDSKLIIKYLRRQDWWMCQQLCFNN